MPLPLTFKLVQYSLFIRKFTYILNIPVIKIYISSYNSKPDVDALKDRKE
jgi:hypothetical protein